MDASKGAATEFLESRLMLTPLPSITEQVSVDATTQPGYTTTPLIELDGGAISGPADGIVIAGSSVLIQGGGKAPQRWMDLWHWMHQSTVGSDCGP